MEGVLVAAAFWQNYLTDVSERRVADPPFMQKTVVQKRNPFYFPEPPKTAKEEAREFFEKLARPKTKSQQDSDAKSQSLAPKIKLAKKPWQKTTFIFAPHPDDEVLCCSQMIDQKIKRKENVKIIFLTDGDGLADVSAKEAQEYGRTRRKESKTAARFLGLSNSDLFFLNFPDQHLRDLERDGMTQSIYTKQDESAWDSYFPRTDYSLLNLKKNIAHLLQRFEPDEIYIPSERDRHPDHQSTSRIVQEIIRERGLSSEVLEYMVHGQQLVKDKENFEKLRLIRIFRSQFHDKFHKDFLEQFAYVPEAFEKVLSWLAQQ